MCEHAKDRKRYLITGGCGFIGSHLAEELLRRGHAVRMLDNLSSGRLDNIAAFRGDVDFMEADLRDAEAVARAAQGVDGIFHMAALGSVFESLERPRDNHDINISGTLNVLLAARDRLVRRVVFASSAAVYGNDPALPKREEMTGAPESPYALAKQAGERYLALFARRYGVEGVSVRQFNVYGPRQDPSSMYSGVISRFVDAVARGDGVTLYGDGLQTRDFVHVSDVVTANLKAMQSDRVGVGERLNVASGKAATLLDLLEILGELAERQIPRRFEPARAGDVRHSLADISRAKTLLGYEPRTSLKKGLAALI